MSDSLRLEITGDDRDRLIAALNLCEETSVTGIVQSNNRLVLSAEYDSSMRLRFPPVLLVDVILEWLQRRQGSLSAHVGPVWPKEPDIDGDCKKGWRLVCEANEQIEIYPHWMIYHK